MKVLLVNRTLASRTGTEIVTRDLAIGLDRVAQEVCVFSPKLGAIAEDMRGCGVKVVDRLADVPFQPDVIHGHHQVETMLALVHFRRVPAIFVCHDRLSWHDSPPRLNAVRRYVAVDWNCRERLVIEAGIPEERTRVILNAVDLRRFGTRQPLPSKPAKALVFSNYAVEGAELEILRESCSDLGLEMTIAGEGMSALASHPEEILGAYDLVFAKSRCALEALACGCAVVLYHGRRLGPMVTSGQMQDLRRWNLGMRCLQEQLSPDAVRCEIARYDPADAARVTEIVRTGASLDAAVTEYVKLYEEAIAEAGDVSVSLEDTLESLARNTGNMESVLRSVGERFAMAPLPVQAAAQIRLRVSNRIGRLAPGSLNNVVVEIENRSAEALVSLAPYPVKLSYHWLDARTGECRVFDGVRTPLSAPVRPRSAHTKEVRVQAPQEPGEYTLVLTLVQEDQFWFDQLAPPVAVKWQVTVRSEEPASLGEVMLSQVAAWTSAEVIRDGPFGNLGFLSDPKNRMLSFVDARQFAAAAIACPEIVCLLTTPELADLFPHRIAVAVAADPKRCFFEIHNRLARETNFYGMDFVSIIDAGAELHPRCWVDEKNVMISAGVRIGPNASVVGRAFLDEGVTVHAGAVIGSVAFQASDRNRARGAFELQHAGGIEIGPDCHIFANAVIARGVFRQCTSLGRGCRVGNGAIVSHNCELGDWVSVGHGAVVNGNVKIGANAWIGPGATVVNGVVIGESAQVSLGATLIRDVQPGQRVTGSLAMEHRKMLRLMARAEKGRDPDGRPR